MGQAGLTTADKLLVAATAIEKTRTTFTAEDLVVEAWHQFPESFGLSGYRERFPDSNRILCKLMGGTGIRSRGWVEQVTAETYRVTDVGRQLATELQAGRAPAVKPQSAAARARAAKPLAPFGAAEPLERLAKSVASQKFSRGTVLTLQDACLFWGVSPASGRALVEKRLEEVGGLLARAEQHVRQASAAILGPTGLEITLVTVIGLQGLHQTLRQRYQGELHVRAPAGEVTADG